MLYLCFMIIAFGMDGVMASKQKSLNCIGFVDNVLNFLKDLSFLFVSGSVYMN